MVTEVKRLSMKRERVEEGKGCNIEKGAVSGARGCCFKTRMGCRGCNREKGVVSRQKGVISRVKGWREKGGFPK
jgi:hypothetical protein